MTIITQYFPTLVLQFDIYLIQNSQQDGSNTNGLDRLAAIDKQIQAILGLGPSSAMLRLEKEQKKLVESHQQERNMLNARVEALERMVTLSSGGQVLRKQPESAGHKPQPASNSQSFPQQPPAISVFNSVSLSAPVSSNIIKSNVIRSQVSNVSAQPQWCYVAQPTINTSTSCKAAVEKLIYDPYNYLGHNQSSPYVVSFIFNATEYFWQIPVLRHRLSSICLRVLSVVVCANEGTHNNPAVISQIESTPP